MIKLTTTLILLGLLFSCKPQEKSRLNEKTLAALGQTFKSEFGEGIKALEARIAQDSTDVEALIGLAETHIILYIFG